jgi:hypothetical protein
LKVTDENIHVLAWGIEPSVLYPGFIALARVAAPSWEVEALHPHAQDANELRLVTSVPARLSSLDLLRMDTFTPPTHPQLAGPWHRTARARLVIALAHLESQTGRSGRERVLAWLGR